MESSSASMTSATISWRVYMEACSTVPTAKTENETWKIWDGSEMTPIQQNRTGEITGENCWKTASAAGGPCHGRNPGSNPDRRILPRTNVRGMYALRVSNQGARSAERREATVRPRFKSRPAHPARNGRGERTRRGTRTVRDERGELRHRGRIPAGAFPGTPSPDGHAVDQHGTRGTDQGIVPASPDRVVGAGDSIPSWSISHSR